MSHDVYTLPEGLPVPTDDGAAAHLIGLELPDLVLESSEGEVNLRDLDVIYVYPRSGRPEQPMLRGWDEGFSIPSLGVAVRRDRVRQGHGRRMMLALHDDARKRGADLVRLRVNPDNHPALSLYQSLGYRSEGFERGELVMHLDL